MRDDIQRQTASNQLLRNDVAHFGGLIARMEMGLEKAVHGERGLMARVAIIEQVQATRPCDETRANLDRLEDLAHKNGSDIAALVANMGWLWRIFGIGVLTMIGAAVYTLIQKVLPILPGGK
jgi:hypothetical protein